MARLKQSHLENGLVLWRENEKQDRIKRCLQRNYSRSKATFTISVDWECFRIAVAGLHFPKRDRRPRPTEKRIAQNLSKFMTFQIKISIQTGLDRENPLLIPPKLSFPTPPVPASVSVSKSIHAKLHRKRSINYHVTTTYPTLTERFS